MAKRGYDDSEDKKAIILSSEYARFEDSELKALNRLLQTGLSRLYEEFYKSLNESKRYKDFVIGGETGKLRYQYYKQFYMDLMREDFISLFLQMSLTFREKQPRFYLNPLLEDVFLKSILKNVFTDNVFLGHYLTHTNTIAVIKDDHRHSSFLTVFVIKNNNQHEYNTKGENPNKRLVISYDVDPNVESQIRGTRFITFPNNKDTQIVSVVASSKTVLFLGFENDLYAMSIFIDIATGRPEPNLPLHAKKPFQIKRFFDEDFKFFNFNDAGIRIKALFSYQQNLFILTMDGKVFVQGENIKRFFGPDFDEKFGKTAFQNPLEDIVFYPVTYYSGYDDGDNKKKILPFIEFISCGDDEIILKAQNGNQYYRYE